MKLIFIRNAIPKMCLCFEKYLEDVAHFSVGFFEILKLSKEE